MNDDLQQRFPEMQPLTQAPTLQAANGIGTMAYGRRDYDDETGTYVKTQCFCFLFVPLFALKAFRVADAPGGGWYFLGRVPLSALAKLWNLALPLLVVAGIGIGFWVHHIGTDGYRAGQKIAEADALAAEGQLESAAKLYHEVALGTTSHAATARERLGALIDSSAAEANPAEAAKALRIAVDLHRFSAPIPQLFERARALAQKQAAVNPRAALALADAVAPLAKDPKEIADFRFPLLEQLAAQAPDDLDVLSETAVVLESRNQLDKCEKLLAPHAAKLGDREGARILGQIFARRGKLDEAHALLAPYVDKRLQGWQAADQKVNQIRQEVDRQVIAELKKGKAPNFDFTAFDKAAPEVRQRLVDDYADRRLANDPRFKRAVDERMRTGKVVGAAMDLGLLLLQRGQGQADPVARRQEMEKAEKTFLAIRTAAGQTADFRLTLGEVYYWLGKQADARKLFDEHLDTSKRTADALAQVASVLRHVGAVSEARKLVEEAYQKETDARKKFNLAEFRSVMGTEAEDRLRWLKLADGGSGMVKAGLATLQGELAAQRGDDDAAAQHFRTAIALYEGLPEQAASLNNCARACQLLYRASGDADAVAKAITQMEKALSLQPGNSILLHNTADNILAQAVGDIIGDRVNLKLLKRLGGLEMFPFLYDDPPSRQKLIEQVRNHAGIAKAQDHYKKLLVLAPSQAYGYGTVESLHFFLRDAVALRQLSKTLESVAVDVEEVNRLTREEYEGKNDDKQRKELAGTARRRQETLAAARKVGGPTFALAASAWIAHQMAAHRLGQPANADELVALAEEAQKAAPSHGTRSLRTSTRLFRSHQALKKQQPAYAALADKGKRSLGPDYLIAVALAEDGPVRKACLGHPDVQSVLSELKQEATKSPEDTGEWTWAMLRSAHPEEAAKVAEAVLKNELIQLTRAIGRKLAPLNAGEAYRAAWALEMAGNDEQARAILQQAVDQGVPLPFPRGTPKKE